MGVDDSRRLWRALSIRPGRGACPAARQLSETRFLIEHAPTLPVPECDTPDDCDCVYRHHADRRSHARPWTGVERRGAAAGGRDTEAG